MFAVRFLKEAEYELHDAKDWDDLKRDGLGFEFILSIEATLFQVARNPFQFGLVHSKVRAAFIKRFPYGIFFLIEDSEIIVLAVFHTSRNPIRWLNR